MQRFCDTDCLVFIFYKFHSFLGLTTSQIWDQLTGSFIFFTTKLIDNRGEGLEGRDIELLKTSSKLGLPGGEANSKYLVSTTAQPNLHKKNMEQLMILVPQYTILFLRGDKAEEPKSRPLAGQ